MSTRVLPTLALLLVGAAASTTALAQSQPAAPDSAVPEPAVAAPASDVPPSEDRRPARSLIPQLQLPGVGQLVPTDVDVLVDRFIATNPDLQRARYTIESSRSRIDAGNAALAWNLAVRANILRAVQPSNEGVSSGVSTTERYDATVELGRQFAWGTQLQLSLQNGSSRSEFPFSTPVGNQTIVRGPNLSTNLTVSATQPLLRGFGRDVVLQARDVAELRLASAELQLVSTASARLLEVVRALTELAYAAEELAIRERSLERTLVQLDIADAELAAGRIAEIELDLLRQRAAANQEAVLVSWANAETRTREVQRLLGESTQLAEAWRVTPPDPTLDWSSSEALCEMAAERSPEVASLEANVDVARADLVRTRDGLRPQLDVTASLSQNGLADNLGDSYLQVVRFDATTVVGGVVFTMPLGNHVARDAQAQAEVALEQATFEVDQARLSLCQQVQELAAQQTLLADRLSLAQFRVDIAQRGLEAEQARFAQGLSTVQTGLQALEDLETAETERLRIDVDARLAAWQAWHLTGQLAETFLAPLAVDGGVSP